MSKVSIVIPTYNRASFISVALQSALAQPFTDLEVVVIDDGSTDNTGDIIGRVSDPRVRYIYQENQGSTAAFNRGLLECHGDYVSVLGSDDWYLPDGLPALAAILDGRPDLGAVSGGYNCVDLAGRLVRNERPWEAFPDLGTETWLLGCPTLLQSSLIRRSWIDRVGGFDETVRCVQDWDFGLRLARAGCTMGWHRRPIFCYRLHPGQISRDATTIRRDLILVLDHFFSEMGLSAELHSMKDAAYAHAYVRGGLRAYEVNQRVEGRSDLRHAIQLDPELVANNAQRLFDILVGWANGELTANPTGFIETAFSNLPEEAACLARRQAEAVASLSMSRFFSAYRSRDLDGAKSALFQSLRYHPSWLLNRGVLSMGLEIFCGAKVAEFGRNLVRAAPHDRERPVH